MKKRKLWLVGMMIFLSYFLLFTSPAWAAIKMDGEFEDWDGQTHITDPQDALIPYWDISDFYWGNNPNDENLYFMLQRYNSSLQPDIDTTIFFDINDNGRYQDNGDGYAVVHYRPLTNNSKVEVEVFRYGKFSIPQLVGFYRGKWGETYREGALRWEFYVPMKDLGIQMGQSIRMYAVAIDLGGRPYIFDESESVKKNKYQDNKETQYDFLHFNIIDRIPNQGDIQWSPIPILGRWGWLGLLLGGLAGTVFILLKRGKLWAG